MKRNNIPIFGLIAFALILSSCSNIFSPKWSISDDFAQGTASLRLIFIASSKAKTLSSGDELAALIESYAVRLTRTGYGDITASTVEAGMTIPNLAVGPWKVTVMGIDAAGEIVASGVPGGGMDTVTVVAGLAIPTTPITLYFDQAAGYGDVNLTYLFPSILGIDSAVVTLKGTGGTLTIPAAVEAASDNINETNDKIEVTATGVKAGSPLLTVSLKKNGIVLATLNEIVWVFRNLPTRTAPETLKANMFGSAPTGPENLALTSIRYDDALVVSWMGTSLVADGYLVERSVQGSGQWVELGTTDDPARHYYVDSTVQKGTAYMYRASALNRFGKSGYATASVLYGQSDAVYLAYKDGDAGNRGPGYMRDGAWRFLEEFKTGSYQEAVGIAADGKDVYSVGYYRPFNEASFPLYWKNEKPYKLESGNLQAVASYIAISGNDIYIAGDVYGDTGSFPVYWVNGTMHTLPTASVATTYCAGIAVQGNDVYVGGYVFYVNPETWQGLAYPVYWKNGELFELRRQSEVPYYPMERIEGIAVSGNSVYLIGNISVSEAGYEAVYWKDDGTLNDTSPKALPKGFAAKSFVYAVTASGEDLYFAGSVSGTYHQNPVYWKNDGSPIPLPVGEGVALAEACGISVSGGSVYISGVLVKENESNIAVYWEDGFLSKIDEGPVDCYTRGVASAAGVLAPQAGTQTAGIFYLDIGTLMPRIVVSLSSTLVSQGDILSFTTDIREIEDYSIEFFIDGYAIYPAEGDPIDPYGRYFEYGPIATDFEGSKDGPLNWQAGDQGPHILTVVISSKGLSYSGSASFGFMYGT